MNSRERFGGTDFAGEEDSLGRLASPEARTMVRLASASGDDGTNDLIVSDVIRRNELQVWFVAEHVVDAQLAHAT